MIAVFLVEDNRFVAEAVDGLLRTYPGVAVAAITRRPHGYVVALVEGQNHPMLNDIPLDTEPQVLKNGDVLEFASTKMQFVTL